LAGDLVRQHVHRGVTQSEDCYSDPLRQPSLRCPARGASFVGVGDGYVLVAHAVVDLLGGRGITSLRQIKLGSGVVRFG
jgi:hypothetical protein